MFGLQESSSTPLINFYIGPLAYPTSQLPLKELLTGGVFKWGVLRTLGMWGLYAQCRDRPFKVGTA